jgi:hypothetical protein
MYICGALRDMCERGVWILPQNGAAWRVSTFLAFFRIDTAPRSAGGAGQFPVPVSALTDSLPSARIHSTVGVVQIGPVGEPPRRSADKAQSQQAEPSREGAGPRPYAQLMPSRAWPLVRRISARARSGRCAGEAVRSPLRGGALQAAGSYFFQKIKKASWIARVEHGGILGSFCPKNKTKKKV